MSARSETLKRIRDSLLAIVEAQTAAWEAAGCPTTFSVDGESYDWNGWLQSKLDAIERLDKLVNRSTPYAVRSRMRG